VYLSIFAAGAIALEIAPTFLLLTSAFNMGAIMVGFLASAFVIGGFILFGGLIMFKANVIVNGNVRRLVAVGTGMVGVFGFLAAYATNYWIMWALRLGVGFGCIMLTVVMMFIAFSWFPMDKTNDVVSTGNVALVLGTLVASFFGSLIARDVGGWRNMFSIFGGIGLLAFVLWLLLGKSMPSATDGAGQAPPERSPAVRSLRNRYVWCSAGMLYILLCYLGVFTFLFIALPGSYTTALTSRDLVYPTAYYVSAILNIPVMISGGAIGLWLLMKTGRRKLFSVVPALFATILGLVLFSLTFSGVWMSVIIEVIVVAVFLLVMLLPTWLVRVQELPGVGFDILVNTIGTVLLITGIAGAIVPVIIGWSLDQAILSGGAQGWYIFKDALYFFVLTWLICAVAGLLIPEPGAST
jgi:predicted MFS family arabinose efflux permease